MEDLGFEVVTAGNLESRHDLFAGTDEERLRGLHELARDESVGAIFFARGGHGCLRVLPFIDWELLARRPRAWIGYSDLTPFLQAVVVRLGYASFHGPMVAADLARGLTDIERDSLLGALAGNFPNSLPVAEVVAGEEPVVEGRLMGGCLSLLCATLGTPWSAPLDGAILALEDVGEPTYRVDRMLTHLRLSGSLARVRGVVLGDLRGNDETREEASSMARRVAGLVPGLMVAYGTEFGHVAPNRTLALGLPARLDARTRNLTIGLPRDER